MTTTDHLWTILMEECGEIIQVASKALRFGANDSPPESAHTNEQRVVYEFNDLTALMEMLKEAGEVKGALYDLDAIERKKTKVLDYLQYSAKLGRVTIETEE